MKACNRMRPFRNWKLYRHSRIKRRAMSEAEARERVKNNTSDEAEYWRKRGEWSERYGRRLNLEERRARRKRLERRRR